MTLLLAVAIALGQAAPPPPAPVVETSPTAETRDLDIAHRQIVEENYQASRAVRMASRDGAITLDAGVALGARRIQVTLHNVKGLVRFRARFDALHQRVQPLPETGEGESPTPPVR